MSKKILQAALVGLLWAGAAGAQLSVMKQQGVVEPPPIHLTRTSLSVKVFPVGDLVCPPKGSPLAEPGDDAAMQAAATAYTNARVEAVKKQILTTVDVDTWAANGVRRSLEYFPSGESLLVINEVATLARVGECLDTMRRLRNAEVLVEVSIFKVPCDASEVKKVFGDKQTAAMTSEELQTLLGGLKKSGRIEMITEPKLVVGNQRTALMRMTKQIPGNDTPVGVSCQMTPDVASDRKSIRLKLDVTNSTSNPNGVNLGNGLKAPAVDSQQTCTTVAMPNGGTTAVRLGIHKVEQKIEQKVPVLGDLPYLDRLFRTTGISIERIETIAVFTASHVQRDTPAMLPPPSPPPIMPQMHTYPVIQPVQAVLPKPMAMRVAEPTIAEYQAACAANKKDEAMQLALQLLKKDPTCFGKGK